MGMTGHPGMTWQQWQNTVIALLQTYGWHVAHFRPAMNQRGQWRTAVAANGKGWPDIVAIHKERGQLLVAELKTGKGRLTPEQKEWLEYFRLVPGCGVFEWKPDDWETILGIVQGGR